MQNIYITGRPGTGKSALIPEFKKRGLFCIGIDEVDGLCAWVNSETHKKSETHELSKEWLNTHEWVCNEEMLTDIVNKHKGGIIVTGVASNQNNFLNLFNKIILLTAPEEILNKRLINRQYEDGNHFGKEEIEREHVNKAFQGFEEKLIKQGAVSVNSNRPLNEVAEEILNLLNKKKNRENSF